MKIAFLTVQPSVHGAENDFKNTIACQLRARSTGERYRVHDVPQIRCLRNCCELVVEFHKVAPCTLIATDLEELHLCVVRVCHEWHCDVMTYSDLPRWRIKLVELLGHFDEHTCNIILWLAVGDDNHIQRLRTLQVSFALKEAGLENPIEALASESRTMRSHRLEYVAHSADAGNIVVDRAFLCVEKEDVNAVGVVGRADWCYGLQSGAYLGPSGTSQCVAIV